MSTLAVVEISPMHSTMPVATVVSQATRALLSCSRIASSTASEIWSQILSGCPSVTDSDVKRVLAIRFVPFCLVGIVSKKDTLAGCPKLFVQTPHLSVIPQELAPYRISDWLPGFTGPVPPPLLIRYKVCRQCHTKYAALLLFLLYMIPPGLSIGNFDIFCKYKKALQPLQPQRLFYLRRSFQKTTSIMRSDRKSPAEP